MEGFVLKKVLPQKRDRMILFPAAGSQLIVTTSLFLMPLLIETLKTKAGLSGKIASLLLSMELAVSALTTLCFSAWVRKRSAQHWALAGGLLTVMATALTLVSPALPVLFVTRLLAGIGAGVVAAEATSVLSRGVDRERLIAIVTIVSITNAAFWLAVLPYIIDRLGYRGPYACLLLICVIGTFLLRRLPSFATRHDSLQQASHSRIAVSAVFVVLAIFLTQLGQGAFWSMEEAYGSRAGFNSYGIGVVLSASTLLLLAGAVGAAWISNRFGRFKSLIVLVAINAVSIVFVSMIAAHWIYIAANVLQSITNLSSVIFQLGLAASLDRSGRVVAVSTGLVTLGNGLGPSLSASLSGTLGVPFVGVVVLVLNCVALAFYCAVKLRGVEETQLSISTA
jgi:predicted MFS family arabinose efflux permease